MIYKVKGEYPNSHDCFGKTNFYLNPDRSINPFTWQTPIHWEGYVGENKVKFTQIDNLASCVDSFDWTEFPQNFETAKPYIVKAIDNALQAMD